MSVDMDLTEFPPEPMEGIENISNEAEVLLGQQTPPRLMITKMVLENFKSYAGVKEIGPFHKCFSSVVGPNGSGKSNVIDAMLFVFGKRAKKLRLNKVSELIHQSDTVKDDPPQFARVSVHFQEIVDIGDGDDDYRVVPDSETVITRIAKRDNSSTYKLGGKNSSFKEIAAYLNAKGIDLDNNRFLILQGEVEMISMMPPKGKTENDEGLLEYLEDIIGSSKFVEATNQAAEKVEALTEMRQEKLNRVKAVEKEKENLEGAKQEAESLLAKEREIRRKQNILYHIHAMKVEKELSTLEDTKEKVARQLTFEREEMVAADKRVKEIEIGLSEKRKDYERTFNELKRTKEEFSAFERKDIKLREEIKYHRSQKGKLVDKITAESTKHTHAVSKREAAASRIPLLEHEITELFALKVNEEAQLEALDVETNVATQQVRRDLETKTGELAPVKQDRAVLQAALDTTETELKILVDSTNRAKHRLDSAEDELASIDDTKIKTMKDIANKEHEINDSMQLISKLEKEDVDLASSESALEKRYGEIVNDIEDAKFILRSSGGKAKSKAVQGILDAARPGGELSKIGVLGRLGDLGTIPEKYDVAVSTACGGMLDNIVVQTTAGAQRCLEFLRKYELGRASFIPLDKQKKGAHDRAIETPEGAPRLFDLITPSNISVTPALFLAVGNTLVASDMDMAARWAYESNRRWRVVTVDGSLIETTGTMSGGGNTSRRGGMRLVNARGTDAQAISSDESPVTRIERLEKEANMSETMLQECRKRRLDIKSEIRTITKTVRTLELSIPKLKLEVDGFESTRQQLTKVIPELRKQSVVTPDDLSSIKKLEDKVRMCESDLLACSNRAERLEAEVTKLQNDILEAGGPQLKQQRGTCNNILLRLKTAEKQLATSKVEILSAEKAEAKSLSAKHDLEEKLFKCERSLSEKEVAFKSLESGALEVIAAFEKAKLVEAEKRAALEEVSTEIDQLKKSQADVRWKEVELLGQIEGIEKQISDCQKKIQQWAKEISSLQKLDQELDFEGQNVESPPGPYSTAVNQGGDSSDGLGIFPHEKLQKYDPEEIKNDITNLQTERNLLSKNANMGAIAEYRKKEADYLFRVAELDEVTEERNIARNKHEELRRQRLEMFMDGFGIISLKLKEMYQMITLGGDAELELVDSLDPFSEGIVFSVRPPKKSWKNISNLSGGEKTLSSLSLVFALHHYKPTPLYVMDEIDAALDFKNVSIVANYIKERTKNAQFIIISLRNNMFELADRLVGIYKTSNCTKSVTINPRAFGLSAKQSCAFDDKTNEPYVSAFDGKTVMSPPRQHIFYN